MVLFRNDFIERYPQILSSDDCKKIIRKFDKSPTTLPILSNGFDRSKKDCSQISNDFDKFDIISNIINTPLRNCIQQYYNKHDSYKVLFHSDVCSEYNVQKYNPGQGYHKVHCENGGFRKTFLSRILAWMIYLNDVSDGGETYFPTQKRKLKPKEGDLYIWPAYFTHPHKGLVSNTQVKYIVTGWVHLIPELP
tara:strand:+ start:150 stop:728 length:579 start_codon:yes stop_codon:yes gene_type:complete